MKKPKRSQQKRITREAEILRYMRMSRVISMRKAGSLINYSDSSINHFEQGRMDIREETIVKLVVAYEYTMEQFNEYRNGKVLPVLSIKDACMGLIDRLDESKLRAVHSLLANFVN